MDKPSSRKAHLKFNDETRPGKATAGMGLPARRRRQSASADQKHHLGSTRAKPKNHPLREIRGYCRIPGGKYGVLAISMSDSPWMNLALFNKITALVGPRWQVRLRAAKRKTTNLPRRYPPCGDCEMFMTRTFPMTRTDGRAWARWRRAA